MVNAYSNNYLENQIKSASPEQLLIMFYDGAIRFVSQAIQAMEENNIEKRNYSCNKACAIISELNATLDHNIGGKIAADLNLLYDYMIRELHTANSSSNAEKAKHIEKILFDLRETWKKAVDINKQSHQPRTVEKHYRPFSAAM